MACQCILPNCPCVQDFMQRNWKSLNGAKLITQYFNIINSFSFQLLTNIFLLKQFSKSYFHHFNYQPSKLPSTVSYTQSQWTATSFLFSVHFTVVATASRLQYIFEISICVHAKNARTLSSFSYHHNIRITTFLNI